MHKLAKYFLQLVLLVIALALGTSQASRSAASSNSAQQTAQTKSSTTVPKPSVTTDASGVIYFGKDQVSETALKGGMLYNGNPERNYRAMILRRDEPGEVEVHTKDTDLFYIVEGAATFATGGTMVNGKETAPDEIRGPSMNGGLSRQVSKGDVLIIPAKVTHWFKEIQQPILYFTVKVR